MHLHETSIAIYTTQETQMNVHHLWKLAKEIKHNQRNFVKNQNRVLYTSNRFILHSKSTHNDTVIMLLWFKRSTGVDWLRRSIEKDRLRRRGFASDFSEAAADPVTIIGTFCWVTSIVEEGPVWKEPVTCLDTSRSGNCSSVDSGRIERNWPADW